MANVNFNIQTVQVSLTTTSGAIPIYLGGVKTIMVRTLTQDAYISIDQALAPTTAFRLSALNTSDTTITLGSGLMNTLYAQAVTGTTILYLIIIVA
jgi:hypothetical protein